MAGYTRNDTTNQIADGNVINAAPLDGEFDAIQAAFNVSSGHTHDGSTTGDGGPISKLGPSQQLTQTTTALTPSGDNTIDLGTSSAEFKDLYLDGIAYIDRLIVAASDGSADGVGSHLQPLTNASFDLGSTTYLWNNAYLVNLNVRKNDAPIITLTNTSTDILAADSVGSIVFETLDTQQSGVDVAKIDAVVVDTLDDTGGDDVKLVFQTGNAEALTTALTLQDDDVIAPDDVFLRSDAAVLNFGADDDVNLTHVADTGLLLNGAMELQFRDSALTIGSTGDGQLDIDADTELELVAPTVDIDASTAVTIDTTTLTITGAANVTGDLDVDNINIDGNTIISTNTDGNIALTPNGAGEVDISKVDIDSGAIDGVTLGTNSAVTEAQVDNININGNSITSTNTDGNIGIVPNGDGKVNLDGDGSSGGVSISDGLVDIRTGTGSRSQVKFYCESSNAHAQTVQPQPHSAGVTNTLTLPAGSDQEIVGTSATQTLTNKTFTSPTLTSPNLTSATLTAPVLNAGGTTTAGSILFKEGTDNGTNSVTMAGPASTTDVTLTLPNVAASTSLAALNLAQQYTAAQSFTEDTLTDGTNIDLNLQTQQVSKVTLGGNRTFNAPSNHAAGLVCVLTIIQDGTGSRTATFNSAYKFAGGSAPTLTTTASARDILVFMSDGTNLREIGRSLNVS
jgi:cytoskeletal protein CcmA (bactofilin family)